MSRQSITEFLSTFNGTKFYNAGKTVNGSLRASLSVPQEQQAELKREIEQGLELTDHDHSFTVSHTAKGTNIAAVGQAPTYLKQDSFTILELTSHDTLAGAFAQADLEY